ncbi:hypothetical protein KKF84_12840 [Myxococcota bacterium]|nr:hypothetical protein [Myxococcota bacterium]MBU1536203.1 hypothetical protein [Myxococcota bacterium]
MKKILILAFAFFLMGCDEQTTGKDSCGDGVIDPGEECDGEDLGEMSCNFLGYHGGQIVCDEECHFDLTECEAAGSCGDGLIQESEECDGSDLNSQTCVSLEIGFLSGTLTCADDCQFNYEQCLSEAVCGDGSVELTEECDGTNLNEATCNSLGYHGGTLSCSGECSFNVSDCEPFGKCPDGEIQEMYEDCDGTNLNEETCLTLGYNGGELTCDNTCHFDLSECEDSGICGDGTGDPLEECDGSDLKGQTCQSQGHEYGGTLGCTPSCTLDTSLCLGFCGDSDIQSTQGESCDGTNMGTGTCLLLGYSYGGNISCSDQCEYDTSTCLQIVQIVAGFYHSCALTNFGDAYCWGYNQSGQVGINSTETIVQTASLVAGGHTFAFLAAGSDHTCGVTTGGMAYCWGNNTGGRLGDGTDTLRRSPVAVQTAMSFTSITAGNGHTCAVTPAGEAYCWGSNGIGQLGDGTTTGRYAPTAVSGGLTFAIVSAGYAHTCGVTTGGGGYCWGNNGSGRLGDGTTDAHSSPEAVTGGLTFRHISAGYQHTCGVTAAGNGYCWGNNDNGRLGDATTTAHSSPTLVTGGYTFAFIETGFNHTCGIAMGNDTYCWGGNNGFQLGDGSTSVTGHVVPTHTWGGQLYAGVATGYYHSCFFSPTGVIYCTGVDNYGQQGVAGEITHYAPNLITSPF